MDTQTRELVCPGAGQQQNGATSGCPAPSALTSLPTTLPSDTELPGEKKITPNICTVIIYSSGNKFPLLDSDVSYF